MKIRNGFVSNSSSSSFLCLGIDKLSIINVLLDKENLEKIKYDNYECYENEGYGILSGKYVSFYGNSEYWHAAGLDDEETKKILEKMNLKKARIYFKEYIKSKLNIDIDESIIGLFYGESSSE